MGYLVYMGGLLYFLLPLLLFVCYDTLTFASPTSNGAAARADVHPALWWSWTPLSLLRSRPLQWFSKITMPFYMIHHEVFGYLERWLPVLPAFATASSNPVASNAGAQLGVVIAWMCAIMLSVLLAWALSK